MRAICVPNPNYCIYIFMSFLLLLKKNAFLIMLLPHFLGDHKNNCAISTTRKPLCSVYFAPSFTLFSIFATYGRINFCLDKELLLQKTTKKKRKTTFKSLKREFEIKREIRQEKKPHTHSQNFSKQSK